MKAISFAAVFAAAALMLSSCAKSETPEVDPVISVTVTEIQDNTAKVTVSLTQGKYYNVKLVSGVRTSTLEFDPDRQIQLISYVEKNGEAVSAVPYEVKLEKLRADNEYLSAAIAYDKDGRACTSAKVVWKAVGNPSGISDQNDAGKLDENVIQ